MAGRNLINKKDVYERYLRLSNLANSSPEDAQPERPHWVYCTLFASFLRIVSTISHDVGYRVAYPGQGKARARQWDKRSRAPTSFHLTLLTAESGVL